MSIVELHVKFIFPAFYDEIVTVTTMIKELPITRVVVFYEIHNEKEKLLVTGETTQVFLDAKTMRPTRIPDFLREDMIRFFEN
ncbi:MAG: hypothetical protein FWH18_11645 [Marinilabiliaceae bacterium]|nr:hypothetical protein [Marinilabiliaceae bacterium]